MMIYAIFGIVLLVQSHRRFLRERRMAHAQAEAAALERLARDFLAVRDFANTPLQTIDSTTALLALRHPELAGELKPIERALARLREMNGLLARHDSALKWDKATEASALQQSPNGTILKA
jgi:hypothetical protein